MDVPYLLINYSVMLLHISLYPVYLASQTHILWISSYLLQNMISPGKKHTTGHEPSVCSFGVGRRQVHPRKIFDFVDVGKCCQFGIQKADLLHRDKPAM